MRTNQNQMQSQTGTTHYQPQRGRRAGLRLPGWHIEAITRPTPRFFARVTEYARWDYIWPLLIAMIALPIILGGIRMAIGNTSHVAPGGNLLFGIVNLLTIGLSLGATIAKALFVPITFFVTATLQYLIAHLVGGRGGYRQQCFGMLLYQFPLALISAIIIAVLVILHISTFIISPVVAIVFFVYSVIINIIAVSGIHNINQNKATATVLIPYVIEAIAIAVGVSAATHALLNTN